MGEQSIAVLLVNFQDDTSKPKTVAEAQDLVFGDVSNHYRESSFGQTWFKGDTFGWYTIALSKSVCDPYKLASLADAQATQAGVNLAAYQRRVYMFPSNSCQWLGLGNVGGTNTQAWVNGNLSLWVLGHELGHNYGLSHAHSMDCATTVTGDDCALYNYGDAADMMGNNRAGQFNPFEKEWLGWLNDGISPPITTVTTGGRYSIEPYSASTLGPKALKIPRGTDIQGRKLWTYVEYRQPIGGDAVLADTANLTKGVMLRIATEGDRDSSFQLDMTPGTSTQYFYEMADGALEVGKSYYDGDTGMTMTLASAGSTGADIDVVFGATTCTRAAPDVWLGALPSNAGPAGSTLRYAVQVTNKDSVACPATTFDLASVLPSGWTGAFGAASVAVNPKATGETVIDITAPVTAALGDYKVSVATSSPVGALHAVEAPKVFFAIVPPCVRAAPTLSLTGGGAPVRAGTTVPYTLSITNRDSNTCGNTNFAIASSVPDGWTATLGRPNVVVPPGLSATVSLNVVSDPSAAIGSHGIGAAISSPVGALHTVSASSTYDIASTCTRGTPTISLTGGGGAVLAGTKVGYTLTVTNRDEANCPATSFDLASSVPEGWAATLSKTNLVLNPGASASAVLDVASDATAAVGTHGIGVATASTAGAPHTANASAVYDVAPPCTRAAPTITLSDRAIAVAPGTTVGYTLTIANRDSSTCAATTFDLAKSVPAGWAGSLSKTAATLSPGASTSAVFNVTSSTTAAVGRYGIGAAASSPIGGVHTASAATTYSVAPKLSIADMSMIEGNGGTTTAKFVVSLTAPAVVPVTFKIATTNGTAAAGSDYTATSLTGVTIPTGSSTATISVPVIGDATVEANETFQVGITSVVGATVSDGTAIATIRNDDTVLSIGDVAIVEGNSGTKTATFTVKLSSVSASPVSFNIATANNTAAAGSDYVARSLAAQTITPGATGMTFTVSIAGDAAVEANETFLVNVTNVKGATVGDAQAVGTIRNDDTVLSITDASIAEGQSGTKTLNFTVKLSAISAAPVSFSLATANKTAAAGSDYVALALTGQSIAAGTMSKAFAVTIKGDTAKEVNETFVVNVGSVVGATVGDAQALGTIANDD
jgi:uncharacterized membrane protein